MVKKIRILLIVYTLAALIGLGGLAWASQSRLEWYRAASDLAAARAFEEAVTAADALSLSLKKLSYAGDEALGKSLCAQAHAAALSCDTALSVLPFATQELEGLLGFLNRAGDYTASLCALSAETLEESDRQHLQDFGEAAAQLADSLRKLQAKVHSGDVAMDRRETPLRNVGEDGTERLSARLLDYESGFTAPEAFAYEGQFSPEKSRGPGTLTDGEARALAAKAAGVEERELREEYTAEGPEGRRCYSAGGLLIGVSRRGLEFMGRSRLVSAASITLEQAQEKAEAFLKRMGYEDLSLCASGGTDTVAAFVYAPTQDGVMRPDDSLRISIALDDGSVYAFDATKYSARAVELSWNTDEDAALATLPEGVQAASTRPLIIKSQGGAYLPCWELTVAGGDDGSSGARVYVDAGTGRQCKVDLR